MAKSNIKNLDKVLEGLKKAVSQFDDVFFLSLGEYVTKRIVQKARTGRTMVNGGSDPIKPLSSKYIKERERLARVQIGETRKLVNRDKTFSRLNPGERERVAQGISRGHIEVDPDFFSPRRSNLTLTGQWLKSIALTRIDRLRRILTINATGTRKGGLSNDELSGYLAKQGRNVFGMDETGRKVLKNMVVREIRKQLRKNLLRK